MQAVKKAILCAIYLHPKETIIGNNTFLFPFCCPKGTVSIIDVSFIRLFSILLSIVYRIILSPLLAD